MCSHKSNGPGMSHELALHIWLPRLVWVRRNPQTKTNDLSNHQAEPKAKIPAGKKCIVDRGCRDKKDPGLAPPNSFDSEELRTFKARCRMRQESFHSKLDRFGVVQQRFRSSAAKHEMCFFAVCVLCQCEMEIISPVFQVQSCHSGWFADACFPSSATHMKLRIAVLCSNHLLQFSHLLQNE